MENYKRSSLTPDQAAQCVVSDLVERVSLFGERNVVGDLSQMDPRQLRDRLYQFCQRSNLDYRDFEDASCILRPRIVMDTKNSVRASAIRKRTSTSPVEVQPSPPQDKVVKTRRRGRKKADPKESPPVEKRVLRQLPGRARGRARSQTPVDTKQDSIKICREREEEKKVAEVIDLWNDSEDEASKVAEVQKKSLRGKRKRAPAVKATTVASGSLEEDLPSKAVSIDKCTKKKKTKDATEKVVKEKSSERTKSVVRRRKREVSLDDATNCLDEDVSEPGDELRRRTRSRGRRVVIPQEIPKPPPRKRRSCVQRKTNYDFESEVEIVDIIPRRHSHSPPMLSAIKVEPPSPKPANKTKPKRTRKRRKTKTKSVKKDSPILKPVEISKVDDDIEIEPPVLHNSVAETETRDALKMEPPLLESAEPIKKRNSKKAKTPSFELPVIKTADMIKTEPFSTDQDVQKVCKENTKSVVETTCISKTKQDNKNPILSTNNKLLKNTIEPTSTISVVKSDSSKRKQDCPIKYFKQNSKKVVSQTFLELNSNNRNLTSDVCLSHSTSNVVSNLNSANLMKVDTLSAVVPASDNPSESLKERYRKSFCVESLPSPNKSRNRHKESVEKSLKTNSLQRSNNSATTPKGGFETSSHLNQSMAKESDDFATKLKINNSDKTFYNLLKNIKAPCDISSSFITKVKEEPLSDDDIPYSYSHVASSAKLSTTKTNSDNKTVKPAKSATTLKAKSDIKTAKKLSKSAPTSKDNKLKLTSKAKGDTKTEKKPPNRSLSIKNVPRRRSSQSSELQVVLTILPDAQVDLQNGSVTDELMRKCEKEQERMEAVIKEEVLSEYDSDEDKPLACFQTRRSQYSRSDNNLQPDSSDKKGSAGTWKDNNLKKPRSVNHRRYSDSEDSDCGLVIDLDRRLSVEEQVPSPANTDKDTKEAGQDAPSKESISVKSESTPLQDSTEVKEPVPSTSRDTFYHNATEAAHILLELSISGMRSLNEETVGPSTSAWTVNPSEASGDGQPESGSRGSILRTLLLEIGDIAPGQDPVSNPGPSTSDEPQSTLSQEAERDLLRQGHLSPFLASENGRNHFDPSRFSPDQIPPDFDLDLDNCEWTLWDLEAIRAEIQKLRNEIKGLSKMADGKDRERTSIMCYMKYKEEVLKRLLKRYSAKVKNQEKDSTQEKSEKESAASSASTSTPNGEHQISEELSYRLTVRTGAPSATVTSSDSLAVNSGENLPPVATMVANATDNYGVDLRTVTSRQEDVSPIPTILQEALSSPEPIYRPIATRSPLRHPERADEPSPQMVQKKSLATQDCSFVPNLPSNSEVPPRSQRSPRHYSRRRFRRSPPSLNPEFTQSSSLTTVTPPHARAPSETAQSHHALSTPSYYGTIPSSTSSQSSPKGSSSTTNRHHQPRIILRTEPGTPLNINSIDLSSNNMLSNRFTTYGRTNDHSSHRSTIRASDNSFNRSTSTEATTHSTAHSFSRPSPLEPYKNHSSNRSAYLEMTPQSFSRSSSNQLNNSHSPSRSTSIRPTHGDSSNRSAYIEMTPQSFNLSSSTEMNNSRSSSRSSSIRPIHGPSSNSSSTIGLINDPSSNSVQQTHNGHPFNRPASNMLTNNQSSNRTAPIELTNNSHSSYESASSGLSSGHSSNTFGMASDHSSFMIVPPPTTLQSSFGLGGLDASMPEAQIETAMDIKVEDTHELETEEGPQLYFSHASSTSFVPYAGPLTAIAPTLDPHPRCKGCGNDRPNFVCSGCKSHWYCSTECQNLRWAEHSRTCPNDHLKDNSKSYK